VINLSIDFIIKYVFYRKGVLFLLLLILIHLIIVQLILWLLQCLIIV